MTSSSTLGVYASFSGGSFDSQEHINIKHLGCLCAVFVPSLGLLLYKMLKNTEKAGLCVV